MKSNAASVSPFIEKGKWEILSIVASKICPLEGLPINRVLNKQIPADCPYVSENYLYLNRFIIIYRKHTPHYIIGNYSSKSVCSPIKASVVGKQGQLAFANDCPIATQCIILELFWLLDLLT